MSKSTFTYTNLAGDRALVTDGGKRSTVLNVADWNEAQRQLALVDATEEFNAEVAEFYFTLTEAAERVNAVQAKAIDPNQFVVINEGVEGEQHVCAEVIDLSYDSQIARLINEGQTDRLVWVGNDSIEILAYEG